MLKTISSYTLVLLSLVILNSCKKEYESIQSIDDRKIQDYIAANHLTATADPGGSGFYYQIVSQGTGEFYTNTDSVRYRGDVKSLASGITYYGTPTTNNLGTLVGYTDTFLGKKIPGIITALNAAKPGAVIRLLLPSYLAFGKNGSATIGVPSNDPIDLTITTYAQSQAALDDQHIKDFLTAKGIAATKDESGVYYQVNEAGTGTEVITKTSDLTVNYTGRTLEGAVFDSNTSGTFVTNLTGTITGWLILQKFKKGAKVRIFIPSVLAYGNTAQPSFSANTCLDFDVEIVEVTN